MRALTIAATGMDAQQTRVEVISNNISNMSTTAYQARRAEFADLHYQTVRGSGAASASDGSIVPEGVYLGMGVRTAAVSMTMTQGSILNTANELDLAIEGKGYFEITLPSGDAAFSRAGNFKRTAEGLMVNTDGYPLAANITIPDGTRTVTINGEGEVYAFLEGQPAGQLLGTINLASFSNPKGLEPIGGTLFKETEASGAPTAGQPGSDSLGTLRQGFVEQSNVDVVAQISELIQAQRGYELNSKVISAADQMMGATSQIR